VLDKWTYTGQDKIRNESIRKKVGVAPILENMEVLPWVV